MFTAVVMFKPNGSNTRMASPFNSGSSRMVVVGVFDIRSLLFSDDYSVHTTYAASPQ